MTDKDNMNYAIEAFAKSNATLLQKHWGKDGKAILAEIRKHAGIADSKATTHHFDAFWAAWPSNKRKVNKEGCRIIWMRWHLDDLVDDILKALDMAKRDEDWLKERGAYIPMPSVWLNQRRWEALLEAPVDDMWAGVR